MKIPEEKRRKMETFPLQFFRPYSYDTDMSRRKVKRTRKRTYLRPFSSVSVWAGRSKQAARAIRLLNRYASMRKMTGAPALAEALCEGLPDIIARLRGKVKAPATQIEAAVDSEKGVTEPVK